MKKFLFLALALLLPIVSYGKALSTDEKFLLNNDMGPVASLVGLGDMIDSSKTIVRVLWDATQVMPGATTANGASTVTGHNLGVALPANAVITNDWYQVLTATDTVGSSNGGGKLSLACETAGNIKAVGTVASLSAGTITQGVSDNTVSNFKKITNACNVTSYSTIQAFSVGKIAFWIEYYVSQ